MSIEINTNNLNDSAISTEMFMWIAHNFDKGSTILELGSGTGTIELTKYYKVYSIEQDKKWINFAKDSTYIHAPIKDGWYDFDIVFNNIPSNYDLLLVDGPGGTGNREGIKNYWDKLNTDVPIVMDDTHREAEFNFAVETANTLDKKITIIPGHQKTFALLL
tara:strand:- start:203 stop:688 length:486 start_codon:yes stop_codon:yes gene_type:complete